MTTQAPFSPEAIDEWATGPGSTFDQLKRSPFVPELTLEERLTKLESLVNHKLDMSHLFMQQLAELRAEIAYLKENKVNKRRGVPKS